MASLTQADDGRALDVAVGETVRIALPENASTGHRWAVDDYDRVVLESLDGEARYPTGSLGSAGEVVFSFRARARGTSAIRLKALRSWEGDASIVARFAVMVRVTG